MGNVRQLTQRIRQHGDPVRTAIAEALEALLIEIGPLDKSVETLTATVAAATGADRDPGVGEGSAEHGSRTERKG